MESFATVSDLEARWRSLDDSERVRAETLLMDASAYLSALLVNSGVTIEDSEIQSANLRSVCCAMVHRIMGVDDNLFGVTQFSQTAGSFTSAGTSANPNGDMYLTASEKRLLGIPSTGKKQRAVFVRPKIHYGKENSDDCKKWI